MNFKTATALLLICGVLAPAAAVAQVPRTISYQGVLMDPAGNLIPNGSYAVTIRMYESLTGETPIYSETQNVVVVRGIFNMIIGSATPIPTSVSFDRGYFLGISVNNGAQMSPRVPLTAAPYAIYAATAGEAKSLAPGAGGVVTSLNGAGGALRLRGAGSTTVNRNGDTITISSVGGSGGTGIQGVQNNDNSLTIANGSGPVATIDVADGGIGSAKLAAGAVTTAKLADGAVTALKLADGAVTNGKLVDGAVTSAKILDGSVATADLLDSAVTSAKIARGAITQEKIAAGVSFPPAGAAGGDLAGTYPNPTVANNAITTTKIADGTITGGDISGAAALAVASLTTTGSAGIGITPPTARLTVQGSGTTNATAAFTATNSAGTTLLHVRDDGSVGINTKNPGAALEVVGGQGQGFLLASGSLQLPLTQVQAAGNVQIPAFAVIVRITDDAANIPIVINMPGGAPGQVVIISNDDAANIAGVAAAATPINPGQTRMFIFTGGGWRLVN